MLPLSSSSMESVWYRRPILFERRMANTDAASVELITAPIRRLSSSSIPRIK